MPAPVIAAGGALLSAAALGAAGAAGAAAGAGAARAVPGVTAAVRERWGEARSRVTLPHEVVTGRLLVGKPVLRSLVMQAEKCPIGHEALACPCQHRPTFHTDAVEYLRLVEADEDAEAWRYEPDPSPTEHEDVYGELEVDKRKIWFITAERLYASADLPSLAVREGLQNSVDAIAAAIDAGQVREGSGLFQVEWDSDGTKGTLVMDDNGIGMEYRTVTDRNGKTRLDPKCTLAKFFTLAASGKDTDTEAAGGFGLAKAVILGASPTGRWEVHTRDRLVTSTPQGYTITPAPFRQGTRVTLRDVPDKTRASLTGSYGSTDERLREVLRVCTTPAATLTYNGAVVPSYFAADRGRKIPNDFEWGDKVRVALRRFDRTDGQNGRFWVRVASRGANMLIQWTDAVDYRAKMLWDVVVDVKIGMRPTAEGYPIKGSRDGFVDGTRAASAYEAVQQAQMALGESSKTIEYSVVEPDEAELEDVAAWADDPSVRALLREIAGVTQAYRESAAEAHAEGEVPAEYQGEGPRVAAGDVRPSDFAQAAGEVRRIIERAHGDVDAIDDTLRRALDRVENGTASDYDIEDVVDAVDRIAPEVDFADGVRLAEAAQEIARTADPAVRAKAKRANPFGRALIKISNEHYDSVKVDDDGRVMRNRDGSPKYDHTNSRKFLRKRRKFLPHLIVWDAAVRLTRAALRFQPVGVGFVLDRSVRGLCTPHNDGRVYVLLNPESFQAYVDTHRERPDVIAYYLHAVASHELANVPRIGAGHNNAWAVAREDNAMGSAQVLEALTEVVMSAFKLKDPNKKRGQMKRLRDRLAEAEAKLAAARNTNDSALIDELREENLTLARRARTANDEAREARAVADKWVTKQHRLTAILNMLNDLLMARDFTEFLRSPVGREATARVSVPGFGSGADALLALAAQEPAMVLDLISVS